MEEIYHSGEREIQKITGEALIANANGRVIANTVITGAINFIEQQPMSIVSSMDSLGQVWASALIGNPGFSKVPEPDTLIFDKNLIRSSKNDVFFKNIEEGSQVGSLFIELETRRRFRINGTSEVNGDEIKVNIHEAYPNCPKYIQRRRMSLPEHLKKVDPSNSHGEKLQDYHKNWIEQADTLFVGSIGASGKLDVSHRGGNSGFIEILDDNTLKIPDYQGNSMYNTLGNFVQNPNSGILFIDFENRQTLQLSGKAELLFNQNSELDRAKTTDTGRYWLFKTEQWIRTQNHHEVNWRFVDNSPFNPKSNV